MTEATDQTEPLGNLVDIQVVSGTAHDPDGSFRGFVTVTASREGDGAYLRGQMSPDELRQHALGLFAVAEAAEQDAMVFSVLTKRLEMPTHIAARVVADMRAFRADPENRQATLHPDGP